MLMSLLLGKALSTQSAVAAANVMKKTNKQDQDCLFHGSPNVQSNLCAAV